MSTELPKTYDPASVEPATYELWLSERSFHAEPTDPGQPYCIVIPPPNVTGALHLGHAINNTLQDILIRVHRMRGFNTVWIPGIDHAGIATQAVVEKELKERENKTRHDIGREALVQRIWQWKNQYGQRILEQLKRLGCSCDWDRTRFTLDEQCARAVRETFFKLFRDGLIYRGKRLVNWDVHLQTSISDDEIYYETVKTSLWHVRYPIVDQPDRPADAPTRTRTESAADSTAASRPRYMIVATTRPETMLGDTAVAVHPDDPRWNWAIGKFVELPLTGRKIPIIADPILVNMEFGSGCVKVTPAHDPNDYACWQRQNGRIDIINILTPDGRINDDPRIPEKYRGMPREQARKMVVEDLMHAGLLEKEEPYETQVGHSDRSKTPIEPFLSDQWFVKMAPLAEPALQVVREGIIKFFPERHAQQYLSWLGEKRDWPISRQLWWGHRIPVWSRSWQPEHNKREDRFADDQTWPERINIDDRLKNKFRGQICFQRAIDERTGTTHEYACVRPGNPELEAIIESAGFVQDPDVLDTWFSSALWPHSTLGWPERTAELETWYPTSVLVTGRDIITLWVARMVMMGMYNMGTSSPSPGTPGEGRGEASSSSASQPDSRERGQQELRALGKQLGIPFYHVAINPTILDGKGERMSKSKGNGVDPVDIIESHGADALRFTLTHMATETQDVRMPVKRLPNGKNTSEKFDLGRNLCNKLWNAARFVLASIESVATEQTESTEQSSSNRRSDDSAPAYLDETKWSMADRWIVSRFNRTVAEANDALANYRFDQYARACYDFFWRDFCDWYVEASKPALKDPARAPLTAHILASVLDGALRLMHPIIPFITETIWQRLNQAYPERGLPGRLMSCTSPLLIRAAWPQVGDFAQAAEHIFPRLQEIIVAIRNLRNQYKVDAKKTVTVSILAPGEAARQIHDAREMIELLATCMLRDVRADLSPIANAARALAAGCEIYVEGLVDPDAERQRIAKRRDELTRQILALRARLSNHAYLAKAPPHLVEQTRTQLTEAEAELAKLG
ncbi:valine--tRNA ligase [Fontivita pretiosa]|uniref:valine--tRNA ligase n=1 Tax=Fontivita pretiosa TaxID=2989684 RepID=UPI003D17FC39